MRWRTLFIVALLLGVTAIVQAETLYVRPASACANNGDGSAYACAASGGAAGAFRTFANVLYNASTPTVGSIDPGDTLKMCGSFVVADQQSGTYFVLPTVSGTANARITFDGDCSGAGGLSTATFDGASATLYGFNTGVRAYLTITHLIVQNTTQKGILGFANATTDLTVDKFNILDHVTVQYILGSPGTGFDMRGRDWTIQNSLCQHIGNDCVQHHGKRLLVQDSQFLDYSVDNVNSGDGVQMGVEVDGSIVRRNIISQPTIDSKYCSLASAVTDAGFVRWEQNTCLRGSTFTVASGIYTETDAIIHSNTITGGKNGIQCAVGATARCEVIGNVIQNANERGVILGSTSLLAVVVNNTIVGSATDQCIGIGITGPAGASVIIENNILQGCPIGINKQEAANVDGYNLFYLVAEPVAVASVHAVPGTGSQIAVNPLFSSATNYQLQSSSPARRAGLFNPLCVDLHGSLCQNPPDLGAYQVTSSGGQAFARTLITQPRAPRL